MTAVAWPQGLTINIPTMSWSLTMPNWKQITQLSQRDRAMP